MIHRVRRARWLAPLVVASATVTTAQAAANQCELLTPSSIDHGLLQSFSVKCDAPFVGFIQVGVDASFSPSFKFPIAASQPVGSDHLLTSTIRVPWDIQSVASEFHVRGFALDGNGDIELAGPAVIPVAQGDRVYRNAAPDAGKNLFVMEMEFEQNTDSWEELNAEPDFKYLGYYRWTGSNHFSNSTNGRMIYRFQVDVAGTYALAFRSGHFGGDQNNDCWCQWDGLGFEKVLCGQDGFWRWQTTDDHGGGFKTFLDVGVHTLTYAARSKDFNLDRFHIFNLADYSRGDIEDETLEASTYDYQ